MPRVRSEVLPCVMGEVGARSKVGVENFEW